MVHPARTSIPGHQTFLECTVKTFNHAVALGVVGRGTKRLHPEEGCQFRPQSTGELTSLIRRDVSGDTEPGDPVADEGAGTVLGSHGRQRNGFWPASKAIHDSEKISHPFGFREGAHKVHVE